MSGFNLLPWREARREQRRREFRRLLALAVLLGATIVFAGMAINAGRLSVQRERNALLSRENAVLDQQIREVRGLRDEIDALNARRAAVEQLQGRRAQPVRLLDQLVDRVPEGVVLKSIKQGDQMLLTGQALSNARVSEFLHALDKDVRWLGRSQLLEVKAVTAGEARDPRRLVEFTIALDASVNQPEK